jgi:hypothetical protein
MPHRHPGLSAPGSSAISLRAVHLPQRYPLRRTLRHVFRGCTLGCGRRPGLR